MPAQETNENMKILSDWFLTQIKNGSYSWSQFANLVHELDDAALNALAHYMLNNNDAMRVINAEQSRRGQPVTHIDYLDADPLEGADLDEFDFQF